MTEIFLLISNALPTHTYECRCMVSFAGFTHHAAVPSYPLGSEVWGGGLTHLQVLVTVDASLCVCLCVYVGGWGW